MSRYKLAALYQFIEIHEIQKLYDYIEDICHKYNILGSLIIANEGINGTIAGYEDSLNDMVKLLCNYLDDQCVNMNDNNKMEIKFSYSQDKPFHRFKVTIKKEIVTMGCEDVKPAEQRGEYVDVNEWNDIIKDPNVVLIDTRNQYEVDIGTFQGAIDPKTTTFREFPKYVEENLDPSINKKVAMFCTGGIRCEKASAYMKSKGFEHVYHLKGGILKYLEHVEENESLWKGECYVFDSRTSVKHGLEQGTYIPCRSCRRPLSPNDILAPEYEEGVCCQYCHNTLTDKQKEGARHRHLQIKIAEQNGTCHLGQKYLPHHKDRSPIRNDSAADV